MTAAARVLDLHTCPLAWPMPHVGGTVQGPGLTTVLIGNRIAATQGTACTCAAVSSNSITGGSRSVSIGGKPAARAGDPTAHGGKVVAGCSSVVIGG